MHTHAETGGQLGEYARGEVHPVVAGRRGFRRVREGSLEHAGVGGEHGAHRRHERDISPGVHAHRFDVHVTEAPDRAVGPLVARVREVAVGVGRELDHPEGRRRAGEGKASSERADERIDVGGEVGG